MSKQRTILVAVRVPADLVERMDAAGSRTDILLEGLRARLDGAPPDAPITAIFGDGERRVVGTGHEGGVVTVVNAGAIILELQDRISELECQAGESTRDISGQLLAAVDRAIKAEERSVDLRAHLRVALSDVETLQSDVVQLKRELAARSVMAAPKTVQPVDLKTHHQSGPVLASAVPVVDGNTGWSGLKGSDKKGKPR